MNYKQAKQVMPLAQRNIEVLEELDMGKCPECKGSGLVRTKHYPTGSFKTEATLTCRDCKGTGKVKWKWEPKFGQMVIYEKKVALITGVNPLKEDGQYDILLQISSSGIIPEIRAKIKDVISILDWQEIEKVLEKAGYIFSIRDDINPKTMSKDGFQCTIEKGFEYPVVSGYDKSRQKAVMLAVEAFGKELENERQKTKRSNKDEGRAKRHL